MPLASTSSASPPHVPTVEQRRLRVASPSSAEPLSPIPPPSPYGLRRSFRDLGRLARLFRAEWPALGRAGALSLVVAGCAVAAPLFTAALFDRVYPSGNTSLLNLLVLGLLITRTAEWGTFAVYNFTAFAARVRMRDLARLALFNHVLHLPARHIEAKGSGEIAARFTDVRDVLDTGADAALKAMSKGVYLLAVPPLLFLLDVRLAFVALVAVPLTATVTAGLGTVANRYWRRTYAAYDEWSRLQVEAVREARTFKAMGCEGALVRRAQHAVARAHAGTLHATALWYVCTGANGLVRAANTAALTWFGWTFVLDGSLTLGGYVAFMAYAGLLLAPLSALIDAGGQIQRATVSLGRVFDYVDDPAEGDPAETFAQLAVQDTGTPPLPIAPHDRLTGRLRIERLRFRYAPNAPGLDVERFELAPGEAVALVGPSGCGKSTLLRLLARIEHPDAGTLAVEASTGWRRVTSLPLSAYRRQLAVCWQEPGLLSSSVRDNLLLTVDGLTSNGLTPNTPPPAEQGANRYAPPAAKRIGGGPAAGRGGGSPVDPHLWSALDVCALANRVADLPHGLDTPLSEGAAALSAGERQRLALARTLLRTRLAPPGCPIRLVLLDEAAANLDTETAARVVSGFLDALRHLSDPPAVVLVTHRPAHAALADRTVELPLSSPTPPPAAGDGLPAPSTPTPTVPSAEWQR
ncbi:MAG: ABC transporter transmembrane domain-containing protein [Rhodothermales bacterium]